MKRRFLIFSVLLAFSLTVFAGCDNTESENSTSLSSSTVGFTDRATSVNNIEVDVNLVNIENYSNASSGTLKEVIKELSPSVVEVYAKLANGTSAGSGVCIFSKEDVGFSGIITCHHVIENAETVIVKTNDGTQYTASLIGSDPDSDICLMSVDAELPKVSIWNNSDALMIGEPVIAIGNPLGTLGGTVTSGILSATAREIVVDGNKMTVLQTDAAINKGNSGGGLFTQSGLLIGMVNAGAQSSYNNSVEGLSFAIPTNSLMNIVNELIDTYNESNGESLGFIKGKYKFGCVLSYVSTTAWASQGYVRITALEELGSFYLGGLRVGDKIVSVSYSGETYEVASSPTTTQNPAEMLIEYLNGLSLQVGDILSFNVKRNNTLQVVNVEILQYIYGYNYVQ